MIRDYSAEKKIANLSWLTWKLAFILILMSALVMAPAASFVLLPRVVSASPAQGVEKAPTPQRISAVKTLVAPPIWKKIIVFLGLLLVNLFPFVLVALVCLFLGRALDRLNPLVRWLTIFVNIGLICCFVYYVIHNTYKLSKLSGFLSLFISSIFFVLFIYLLYPLNRLLLSRKYTHLFSGEYQALLGSQFRIKEVSMEGQDDQEILLDMQGLQTYFHTDDGIVKAVDGVSLRVHRGSTLGVVGESGCGKSVTSMSIMRLLPTPPAQYVSGSITFKGQDLLSLPEEEMRSIRGNDIAMIFQEPMTSLNPVFKVGDQITESILLHLGSSPEEAHDRAVKLLDEVGIPSPEQRVEEYPHQMSGGMKQRVMIAMALAAEPDLLIADEPTTALDVTIQAQILDLLRKIQKKREMSIILITHDLAVIAEMADEVAVMYAGKVVEYTDCTTLFQNPQHPYTIGLFNSIPQIRENKEVLDTIKGMVPNPLDFPKGCRFSSRCPFAQNRCKMEPGLELVTPGHQVACWRVKEVPQLLKKLKEEKASETAGKANVEAGEANVEAGEANVEAGEANVEASEGNAEASEANAQASKGNAKASEGNAEAGEGNAKASEGNAEAGEGNAKATEGNSAVSAVAKRLAEDPEVDTSEESSSAQDSTEDPPSKN